MEKKVRVYYDKEMDTIDVWFDDPPDEGFSREISDGIIVKYNSKGVVVGIEILFLSKQKAVLDVVPEEIREDLERAVNEFVNAVKAIA